MNSDAPNGQPEAQASQSDHDNLESLQALALLGTMTAGLIHDLSNPAASLIRAASRLMAAVEDWQQSMRALGGTTISTGEREAMDQMNTLTGEQLHSTPALPPLERSDHEDSVQRWLEDHGVDESWSLAPILVGAGWYVSRLCDLESKFTSRNLPAILWWLGQSCTVQQLINEIASSAHGISDILEVGRAQFANDENFDDQVSLLESLDRSLSIHRQKLNGLVVERDFVDLTSEIQISSEFLRVWTNLLDNAIDALAGEGTLTIRTYSNPPLFVVEIEDTGPGIPASIHSRVFEPFVTTKPHGEGTGLGLYISRQIALRHAADLQLESRPGCTIFRVQLPLRTERNEANEPDLGR